MSVLDKSFEDIRALGPDAVMQHAKDVIDEYYETHTKEEYAQFVDWLKATVAKTTLASDLNSSEAKRPPQMACKERSRRRDTSSGLRRFTR